jgi:hypothetical protein
MIGESFFLVWVDGFDVGNHEMDALTLHMKDQSTDCALNKIDPIRNGFERSGNAQHLKVAAKSEGILVGIISRFRKSHGSHS